MIFQLVVILGILNNAVSQSIVCFEAGECTQSLNIGDWSTPTAQDCLEKCQEFQDCLYFTYYEENESCLGFINCQELTETCDDCFTGQRECQDLQCWVDGRCDGLIIEQDRASNDIECHSNCRDNLDCLWFTFNSDDSECLLYETCPFIESSCTSCTSGQNQCTTKKDETKVLIIGGGKTDLADLIDDIELVDLATIDSTCSSLPDYPVPIDGVTAAYYQGKLFSCGGRDNTVTGSVTEKCYAHDPRTSVWSEYGEMHYAREGAESSIIQGLWWITGGYYGSPMSTTEIFDGTSFTDGPSLPIDMYWHCQVTLNSTHVLLADVSETGNTYLYDWDEFTWTQVDTLDTVRFDPACGLAYTRGSPSSLEVVVAGDGTSSVFSLSSLTWSAGPDVGAETVFPIAAQLQSTLLVMGGWPVVNGTTDYDNPSRDIYQYDQQSDQFRKLGQELFISEAYTSAVAVPDDFVNCP